ncbi:imidazole glycerol phosphate synthase subunit HisH [Candidatus Bipolaricaulota bacterium]|nr:imidazole glycerol phosphate synthase subunit HisH [Candidatus Bipolaricaulota bacterium]
MIAIVDLGVGNFANVEKALDVVVTSEPDQIEAADKIVLPGVGNFGEVAERLEPLRGVLLEKISDGTPFLGICLGTQLLFPSSSEGEGRGLGALDGEVVSLPDEAAPHIGWNQLLPENESPLLAGIEPGTYFYFVHSYRVKPDSDDIVTGTTEYRSGAEVWSFPSAIGKENLLGVQFHPEKSGEAGLRIMNNFKEL